LNKKIAKLEKKEKVPKFKFNLFLWT